MSLLQERGWSRVACLTLLILGAALRMASMPHDDEFRDVDEQGYLKGSLLLVEGMTPSHKFSPAGPNTLLGWAVTMGRIGYTLAKPPAEIAAAPAALKPFLAIDRTLFDQHHDLNGLRRLWIISQLALTIVAIGAAFRFGQIKGGTCGGLICGGFLALTPVLVDLTMMARPYATGWAFGMLSLWAAAALGPQRRARWTGILFGLAVASRVEMLMMLPLVFLTLADRGDSFRDLCKLCVRTGVWIVIAALLTAPWLLTNLLGNLRTIATVRLGPNPKGPTTLLGLLLTASWEEGLLGALLLVAVGLLLVPFRTDWSMWRRVRYVLLAAYVIALLASMAKGTVFFHQQGPVLLAMFVFAPIAFAAATKQFSDRWRVGITVAILLLPLGQSVARAVALWSHYAPDFSVQWVNDHVPGGTRIYQTYELHSLLPTVEASAFLWDEVTSDAAWRKKFQAGLDRFNVSADAIPRAMSEENMISERGNRRGLFILGGQKNRPDPRFDIRLYQSSPVFSIRRMEDEWPKTSGVLIWHGVDVPEHYGKPVAAWVNRFGQGTYIYCTPDVRPKLIGLGEPGSPATQSTTAPTTLP